MRLSSASRADRGDTIIEVIFAIVIFSFVAISSLAIMNQGIATGEKALEITLVRQQINAQAEALRFIHESRVVTPGSTSASVWNSLVTLQSENSTGYGQASASPYGVEGSACSIPSGSNYKPFILNARTAQIWSGVPVVSADADEGQLPYPQVVYNHDDGSVSTAYGMWIESVPSRSATQKAFVDFHIRACWDAPGSAVPMTLGTIVRLYDPR